jgi:hypothetical protein
MMVAQRIAKRPFPFSRIPEGGSTMKKATRKLKVTHETIRTLFDHERMIAVGGVEPLSRIQDGCRPPIASDAPATH